MLHNNLFLSCDYLNCVVTVTAKNANFNVLIARLKNELHESLRFSTFLPLY